MYYKLFREEEGDYLDTENKCVNLMEAETVLCPNGSPESNDWVQLDDLESALEYYGLTRITNNG